MLIKTTIIITTKYNLIIWVLIRILLYYTFKEENFMKLSKTIKRITITSIVAVIACTSCYMASAAARIETSLTGYVHYVPILKDKFTATTAVPCSRKASSCKSETTVYVYDKNGNNKHHKASGNGAEALEGTQCKAEASIRNCYRAASTHKGRSDAIKSWQTVKKSWRR